MYHQIVFLLFRYLASVDHSFFIMEGNTGTCVDKQARLRRAVRQHHVKRVCEIGFNVGHR
jgi:hypothetical protein